MSKESDRELLVLAAKAAGMMDELDLVDGLLLYKECDGPYRTQWDPLDDDGEALRLAVRLALRVTVIGDGMCEVSLPDTRNFTPPVFEHEYDGDTYAATRRAIVRAAAEIGRGK